MTGEPIPQSIAAPGHPSPVPADAPQPSLPVATSSRTRAAWLWRAVRSVPGLIGFLAAVVGIIGGVAVLLPDTPADPFGRMLYSESFT